MKDNMLTSHYFKEAEIQINKALSDGNSNASEYIERQLSENAYLIIRCIAELKNEIRLFNSVERKRGSNLLFITLWKYLKQSSFVLSSNELTAALSPLNLSITETDLLKSFISACCIIEVGLICRAESKNGNRGTRLSAVMSALRSLDDFDFEEIYSKLCPPVAILEEREALFSEMTKETRALYRSALKKYAKRNKINETDAALLAADNAENSKVFIGEILGLNKAKNSIVYLIAVLLCFLLFLALSYLVCNKEALVFILSVPLAMTSFSVVDFLFSVFCKIDPCPALKLDRIPENGRTLTVITSLLCGESADKKLFDNIERFWLLNNKDGLHFGLLCDLPDSDEQFMQSDKETVEYAVRKTNELNAASGGKFTLFLRKRHKSKDGGFGGEERKRGAVETLIKLLSGNENGFETVVGKIPQNISFLVTLDGDTNLSLDSVSELVGAMLHPLNRARIVNGKVVKGYGILQPAIKSSLESSSHSRFSATVSAVGGIDVYESASFERHQEIFGEGIFCGKGIIDVKLYSELLSDRLPKNKVLSHDLPEGNILRTRYFGSVSFTDSTPRNLIAFYDRLHRWIRGDLQNLVLINGYAQGVRGSWRIIANVLRHLSPVFSLTTFCLSAFFLNANAGVVLCFISLLPAFMPLIFTLLSRPLGLKFRTRRFFSAVTNGLVQSFKSSLNEVLSLAYKTQITVDAFIRTIYRIITNKRLLLWQTAAEVDRAVKEKTVYFIYRCLFSSMLGAFLFFFGNLWISRLLGMLWFLFPLYARFVSQAIPSQKGFTAKQKEKLFEYSKAMWLFFKENVNESTAMLPPDNVQFSPVEATAMRTSPTNIGLYLCSCLAARDFGFIDDGELKNRVSACLETVKRMQKWNGHLYNWYSLPKLELLGGAYVSTVDSGNFCVCLLSLSEGLEEYGFSELAEEARRIYLDANFTALYDKRRDLFSLGYDSQSKSLSKVCYDLYMSEARSGSYFALAFGQVPKEHFKKLRRPVFSADGYIGMASWSGTAFEYFMPQLFLPLYKNSFVDESLRFAYKQQKRFSFDGLFGASESGYYRFDSEMNYQYKAHGISSLSLMKQNKNEMVLSPYSLFLFLCVAKNGPLKGLEAFKCAGAFGKYGFYEAVDLTPSRSGGGAIVQSYMAHHVGMSLLACANAVFENSFIDRFMRHKKTNALYELFQEQIPINARLYNSCEKIVLPLKKGLAFAERLSTVSATEPIVSAIGRGKNSIFAGSLGHVSFKYGEVKVNEVLFEPLDFSKNFSVCFYDGAELFTATVDNEKSACFSFESSDKYLAHICSSHNFSGRVKYSVAQNGAFVVESKSESNKSFSVFYCFDVQMTDDKEFYAHASFARLFVTSSFCENEKALIYRKGNRDGNGALFLALGFSDKSISFEFETSNDFLEAFSVSEPKDRFLELYRNKTGVCVNPCCVIKTAPLAGGEAKLIISCGKSEKEALERLKTARVDSHPCRGISLISEPESRLLTELFYKKSKELFNSAVKGRDLWKFGISGDYPLITLAAREFNSAETEFYLKSFKRLRNLGIKTELCFLIAEEERYSRPLENAVRNTISRLEADDFIGKRCGIFFVQNSPENADILKNLSDHYKESFDSPFSYFEESFAVEKPLKPIQKLQPCSVSKESGYKDHGFTVDKTDSIKAPFCYVLAGRSLGSVVTHGSLGYTFFLNASNAKLCSFYGDPYKSGNEGERLIYYGKSNAFDLIACSAYVNYCDGLARYFGEVEGHPFSVTVYVCEKLPLKVYELEFEDEEKATASFEIVPSIGDGLPARKALKKEIKECGANKAIFFENHGSNSPRQLCAFAGRIEGGEAVSSLAVKNDGTVSASAVFALRATSSKHIFFLGATASSGASEQIVQKLTEQGLKKEKENAIRFATALISPFVLKSADSAMNRCFNSFALYQAGACRFYARASFYQSGGAYGFRDQLQDCLALIYVSPSAVRNHLLRAAARQYVEGDVQHWWHSFNGEKGFCGLRTKCSDDLLWLPYCVADYVKKTDDVSILNTELFYLSSPPLLNENERFEIACRSETKEKLYCHCIKAFDRAFNLGANGLPLMGSCDWNDAFSGMGPDSESVFTAWLYVVAAESFLPLCQLFNDTKNLQKLKERIEVLKANAERTFSKDRFARAVFGNGKRIGTEESDACKIDLLSQAFAVFAGASNEKCKKALKTAYALLFDKDTKIMRLFTPPFSESTVKAGYINGYAAGIRENGGQYTHGALWFASACLKLGLYKEGFSVLNAVNPFWRSENINLSSSYKTEPYAICADIYDGVGQRGRGGWSWYTGAAAWYYKIVLEDVLGIKLSNGFKVLDANPLMEYEGVLSLKDFKLKLKVSKNTSIATLDGNETALPISIGEGEHFLELPLSFKQEMRN